MHIEVVRDPSTCGKLHRSKLPIRSPSLRVKAEGGPFANRDRAADASDLLGLPGLNRRAGQGAQEGSVNHGVATTRVTAYLHRRASRACHRIESLMGVREGSVLHFLEVEGRWLENLFIRNVGTVLVLFFSQQGRRRRLALLGGEVLHQLVARLELDVARTAGSSVFVPSAWGRLDQGFGDQLRGVHANLLIGVRKHVMTSLEDAGALSAGSDDYRLGT